MPIVSRCLPVLAASSVPPTVVASAQTTPRGLVEVHEGARSASGERLASAPAGSPSIFGTGQGTTASSTARPSLSGSVERSARTFAWAARHWPG